MRRIMISAILALISVMTVRVPAAVSLQAIEVYKQASPAVVLIVASSGEGTSQVGAGSVITMDGYIITNAHVVLDKTRRPFSRISVYTRPEEITGDFSKDLKYKHKVSVIDYDRDLDLALLKVSGLGAATGVISLADPRDVMVGAEVVAIGHPEQGGLWSLTYGRISGQLSNQGNVKGKDVYQTDTSVNKGNSGGPLLDGSGQMVGVNTNIARKGSGNLAITGVNFALKSSVVARWLKKEQGISLAYGTGGVVATTLASGKSAGTATARPESEPATEGDEASNMQEADPEGETGETVAEREGMEETKEMPVSGPEEETDGERPKSPEKELPEKPSMSDTILTPKKPYRAEDLYRAVEKEMEDMMMDMKEKFRRKKR